MNTKRPQIVRVLSIYPCAKGFAFAVLETRGLLVSWGIARLYSAHMDEFRQRLDAIGERYRIAVISVESLTRSRRGARAREVVSAAVEAAHLKRSHLVEVDPHEVRGAIGLPATAKRHAVAVRTCELCPELESALPPPRRPWTPEDERIGVFFAVAMAIAAASGHGSKATSIPAPHDLSS